MPLLEQCLVAYCDLKEHFDRFVSQACYTDVDALQSWCITKDKRSLLLVTASDGCTYLLRGSYLGDMDKIAPGQYPGSEGDALLKVLSASVNGHKVLTSHFRLQATQLFLNIFTGCPVVDDPIAVPLLQLERLPLTHVFAECVKLQRAFETFATQLTGECVKLERLRHIHVPETFCSAYIHHTIDTETPFSYVLLRGSQVSPVQAAGSKGVGQNGKDKTPSSPVIEREVLTRQQLLAIVDEHFVLKQNLPVYRWTVAHNVAKGFRGGPEFLRERVPALGASLAALRRTFAALPPTPLDLAPSPRLSVGPPASPAPQSPQSPEDYAAALCVAQDHIEETCQQQVLQLRRRQEQQVMQLRDELAAAEAAYGALYAATPKPEGVAPPPDAGGWPDGLATPVERLRRRHWGGKGGEDQEAHEALSAEVEQLRKSAKAAQRARNDLQRKAHEWERQAENQRLRCDALAEELARAEDAQRAGLERCAELERRLGDLDKARGKATKVAAAAQARLVQLEAEHKETLAAAGRFAEQETLHTQQLEKLREQKRVLRQQHRASREELAQQAAAQSQTWEGERQATAAAHQAELRGARQEAEEARRRVQLLEGQVEEAARMAQAKEEEKFDVVVELRRLRFLHEQERRVAEASWGRQLRGLERQLEQVAANAARERAQRAEARKAAARAKQEQTREAGRARKAKGASGGLHRLQDQLAEVEDALEAERQQSARTAEAFQDALRQAEETGQREAQAAWRHALEAEERVRRGEWRALLGAEGDRLELQAETAAVVAALTGESHRLVHQVEDLKGEGATLRARVAELQGFAEHWAPWVAEEVLLAGSCPACAAKRRACLGRPPKKVDEDEGDVAKQNADSLAECPDLGRAVEELQCRLRTALDCVAEMHADCERRLQQERKASEQLAHQFELDKQKCQEAYGRLLAQIQEQYQGLLRVERRALEAQQGEATKELQRRRQMLDHLLAVQSRRLYHSAHGELGPDLNGRWLAATDPSSPAVASTCPSTAYSPAPPPLEGRSSAASSTSSAASPVPTPLRRSLFALLSPGPHATPSGVAVGSGSLLASLSGWLPGPSQE